MSLPQEEKDAVERLVQAGALTREEGDATIARKASAAANRKAFESSLGKTAPLGRVSPEWHKDLGIKPHVDLDRDEVPPLNSDRRNP